ncbi:50S ribosomal protein L21 [Buchnera aphidicola (Eriosoma lanigerum)]|uniref:50S ribosomal protein L21 n=1 Tax=Buchnera aphidicola TaxID=9 RepID=UPI0034646DD1
MYAIFNNGGKQYLVKPGQIIQIEKLNKNIGEQVQFTQILMISNNNILKIGKPYLTNSVIKAHIINQGKHKKINIIKFKRRKHYKKQQGHRQSFTLVKIQEITNIT